MTPTAEITIYFIAFLIVGGMSLIVHTMNKNSDRFSRRLELLRSQVQFLMLKSGYKSGAKELEGEIELKHPTTGEKLKTKARFRPK